MCLVCAHLRVVWPVRVLCMVHVLFVSLKKANCMPEGVVCFVPQGNCPAGKQQPSQNPLHPDSSEATHFRAHLNLQPVTPLNCTRPGERERGFKLTCDLYWNLWEHFWSKHGHIASAQYGRCSGDISDRRPGHGQGTLLKFQEGGIGPQECLPPI